MSRSNYFGELFEVTSCCYSPSINHDVDGTPYCPICEKWCGIVYAEVTQGDEIEPKIDDEPVITNDTMVNNITDT